MVFISTFAVGNEELATRLLETDSSITAHLFSLFRSDDNEMKLAACLALTTIYLMIPNSQESDTFFIWAVNLALETLKETASLSEREKAFHILSLLLTS